MGSAKHLQWPNLTAQWRPPNRACSPIFDAPILCRQTLPRPLPLVASVHRLCPCFVPPPGPPTLVLKLGPPLTHWWSYPSCVTNTAMREYSKLIQHVMVENSQRVRRCSCVGSVMNLRRFQALQAVSKRSVQNAECGDTSEENTVVEMFRKNSSSFEQCNREQRKTFPTFIYCLVCS